LFRLATAAVCIAAALLPNRTLVAQAPVLRGYTDRSTFLNDAYDQSFQSLDTLPNGATTFNFHGTFGSGTLSGATIVDGRIEAPGPFSITFFSGGGREGFGADFLTSGPDVLTLSFYSGTSLIGSVSRATSGTGLQFLGAIFLHGQRLGNRVEISTQNAYPLVADNLILVAPEPSTYGLLGTGLLTLGGIAARRRKRAET
jgi:hypothetical protein